MPRLKWAALLCSALLSACTPRHAIHPQPVIGALDFRPGLQGLTLSVEVQNPQTLKDIQFFDGDTWIGTVNTAPYTLTVQNPWGCHDYWLKATDRAGRVMIRTLDGLCADPP